MKKIVFDLDGTLLDSRQRHVILLNDILNKYKINLQLSDYLIDKRNGINTFNYLIKKNIDQNIAKKIKNEWCSKIESLEYLKYDKLYDYAFCLLDEFSNCEKILLTARCNKENLYKQIIKLELDRFFFEVFVVKSDGDAYLKKSKILKELNADLFIGDTKSDYFAAKLSNTDFLFMNEGFNSIGYVYG